jgi:N-dimethylarginine dimethylaminohydrolase
VLVRPPDPSAAAAWREYGWRAEPDVARQVAQHGSFREALERAGAEVVVATDPSVAADPDAVYVRDPVLIAPEGAILLRPGKPGRRGEPEALGNDLPSAAGVPVVARLEEPATVEGGDLLWLDPHTLLAGRSYRTNDAGIDALRDLLSGVTVMAFDLPHQKGPGDVLHLMSLLSPLDTDLVVAHLPLMPARLVAELGARGIGVVEVPEGEFDSMGPNVLALAPRIALAVDGNPETARRMRDAGVDVRTYEGGEISRKGDGGPTCLTLPLRRAAS